MISGYYKSFLFLWILLLIFLIWNCICKNKLKIKNGLIIFMLAFPILENVVIKEHAIEYSYDRMKVGFVLIFILCEAIQSVLENTSRKKKAEILIIVIVCVCSFFNLYSYKNNETYIWEVSFRNRNTVLAEYITTKYPDATYASDAAIRGYMNLLFKRGIYEQTSFDEAINIAIRRQTNKLVYITKRKDYEIRECNCL